MRCFEDAAGKIMGVTVPEFKGDDWAKQFREFAMKHQFVPRFYEIDGPAIISRRLPNGKVHAEAMHPTLITVMEKL
jgi:hypothetical protein